MFKLLLLIPVFCFSQNDSIFEKFTKIETQRIDSVVYRQTEKGNLKYLAALPNIGYNMETNSLNVGISFSNILGYYQTKKRNEIELEKLRFQLIDSQKNILDKLANEYEIITNTFEVLKVEFDNSKITDEIFNLKKKQYDNNKITLEMWLNVQNDHLKNKLQLFARNKNLITKIKYFQAKIKSSCLEKELEYLSKNLITN
jgi:predicted O-linked N-acetylglucosamine transferase (SPINDLY family)